MSCLCIVVTWENYSYSFFHWSFGKTENSFALNWTPIFSVLYTCCTCENDVRIHKKQACILYQSSLALNCNCFTYLIRYATASARSDGLLLLCGGRDANSVVSEKNYFTYVHNLCLILSLWLWSYFYIWFFWVKFYAASKSNSSYTHGTIWYHLLTLIKSYVLTKLKCYGTIWYALVLFMILGIRSWKILLSSLSQFFGKTTVQV